jgi:hypothetical protein
MNTSKVSAFALPTSQRAAPKPSSPRARALARFAVNVHTSFHKFFLLPVGTLYSHTRASANIDKREDAS